MVTLVCQRCAKLVEGLRDLDYEQRLRQLKLPSLSIVILFKFINVHITIMTLKACFILRKKVELVATT